MRILEKLVVVIAIIASTLLIACDGASKDGGTASIDPIAIESSDQCHLCGMVISSFPGPKGELALKNQKIKKFCSNRDAFSYYLQPENTHNKQAMFVHDMSLSPWESPSDDHFMPAEDAYYVYGSSRKAAMGIALASFSKKMDADMFMKEYGGRSVTFNEITLELLASERVSSNAIMDHDMTAMSDMDHDEMDSSEMDHDM